MDVDYFNRQKVTAQQAKRLVNEYIQNNKTKPIPTLVIGFDIIKNDTYLAYQTQEYTKSIIRQERIQELMQYSKLSRLEAQTIVELEK